MKHAASLLVLALFSASCGPGSLRHGPEAGSDQTDAAAASSSSNTTDADAPPPPPEAGIEVISPAELEALKDAGATTYDYAAEQQAKKARAEETQQVLAQAAMMNPDLAEAINAPIPDKPTLDVKLQDGTTQTVELVPRENRNEMLRTSIETTLGGSAADYRVIYEALPQAEQAQVAEPHTIVSVNLSVLNVIKPLLNTVLSVVANNAPPAPPPAPTGRPSDPKDEIGAGIASDRDGCRGTPSADGLYANFDFPLKYMVASVKQQGARGTCGSFALTSAAEAEIAKREQRWLNLSEQDLYFYIRGPWALNNPFRDDGTDITTTPAVMWGTSFKFGYERDWDYNPSWLRTENPLRHSCDGYKQTCADTYHQGKTSCAWYHFWSCATPKGQDIKSRSGVQLDSFDFLGIGALGFGFDAMKAALSKGKSIMLAVDVATGFDHQSGGFVTYKKGEERRGGHLVHMIGYVSNEQLQAKLPKAPLGSGGGYFIIKNSWGECWGDAGFAYLPVDYVRTYGTAAVVVGFKR